MSYIQITNQDGEGKVNDLNEAYEDGRAACRSGEEPSANPYWPNDPNAASHWQLGWDDEAYGEGV